MPKKTFKRFYRYLARVLLPPFASFLIRLIMLTSRVELVGMDTIYKHIEKGDGIIAPFWHGRMFLLASIYQKYVARETRVLISEHRDGELISRVIHRFGLGTVRGSSRRGGKAAMRELLVLVKSGIIVCITPDGPKGPGLKVRRGVIEIAKHTGAPIIPVSYSASRRIILNTWDKFLVPLPFSTVTLMVGDPIHVSSKATREELAEIRQHLENEMNRLSAEADRGW